MDKELYTVSEVCKELKIGRSRLYAYLGKELPVLRFGRSVRIHPDDLERFKERCRIAPVSPEAA